jgi:hypothetical protein
MRVVYIDPTDVDERPDVYNTAFHRVSEHPAFPAEIAEEYDENATDYGKWLSLIANSQSIEEDKIQRIQISKDSVQMMLDAATTSIITGRVKSS